MTSMRVAFEPAAVGAVRTALLRDLRKRGDVPAESREAAVLILSELLTNAILHARPIDKAGLRVTWDASGDGLRISVTDGGSSTQPSKVDSHSLATGGRGLGIVDTLSVRWWREVTGPTSTVHAFLAW